MDATLMEEDELRPSAPLDQSTSGAVERLHQNSDDEDEALSDDDEKPFAWHLKQKNAPRLPVSDEAEEEHADDAPQNVTGMPSGSEEAKVKVSQAPKFVTKLPGAGGSSRMGASLNGVGTRAVALPPRPPPPPSRASRPKEKSQSAPRPGDSASAMPSSSWPNEQTIGASPLVSASPVEGTTATPLQASTSQGLDTSRQITGTHNDPALPACVENGEARDVSSSDEDEHDDNGDTSKLRVVVEEDEKTRESLIRKVEDGMLALKGKYLMELKDLLPPSSLKARPVLTSTKSSRRHAAVCGVSQASDALSRLHTLFHSWPHSSLVKREDGQGGEASTSKPSAFQERSQRIRQARDHAIVSARLLEGRATIGGNEAQATRAPLFLPHSSSGAIHRDSPELPPIPLLDPTLVFPPGVTKGRLFNFSLQTMQQAVKRARYGARTRESIFEIGQDTMIFFWNFDQGMLHGAFSRNGDIDQLSRDSWRVGDVSFDWSSKYSRLGPDLPFLPAELTVPIIGMQARGGRGEGADRKLNQDLSREQCVQLWDEMVTILKTRDGKGKWSTESIYESSSSIAELEPAGAWTKRVPEAMQGQAPKDEDRRDARKSNPSPSRREADPRRDGDRERNWEKDKGGERGKDRDKDVSEEERRKRREKEEKEREDKDREERERDRQRKRRQDERDRELRREQGKQLDQSRDNDRDRERKGKVVGSSEDGRSSKRRTSDRGEIREESKSKRR